MKRTPAFPQPSEGSRFIVFLTTLLALATASSTVSGRCGVQRWSVKIGTDPQAAAIDLTPTPTTIAFLTDLTRFPAPAHWPPPSRIAPEETTLWTLDETLDSYKWENSPTDGDSDYHLFIKDDAGNTMVAEIPFPNCAQGSVWATQIAAARASFDAQFTATGTFKSAQNMPVRITGIGMFDGLHTEAATHRTEWRSTRSSRLSSTQAQWRPLRRLEQDDHRLASLHHLLERARSEIRSDTGRPARRTWRAALSADGDRAVFNAKGFQQIGDALHNRFEALRPSGDRGRSENTCG